MVESGQVPEKVMIEFGQVLEKGSSEYWKSGRIRVSTKKKMMIKSRQVPEKQK